MPKITFMGAGSTVFAKNVLGDCMLTPALQGSEFALYDIDLERLKATEALLTQLKTNMKVNVNIKAYTDRKQALAGAHYVINAIAIGKFDPTVVLDFEIPLKYGLKQTVADTVGIGGIFRGLRTIPVMLDFVREMEEVCPDAWFLNYSNPMAIVTGAIQRGSSIKSVGLCHSVQVCTHELLNGLDINEEGVQWKIAGINHQAWLLEIKRNGVDLYPEVKRLVSQRTEHHDDKVRYEIMKRFGYYVTESSMHSSEYYPYFIKNQYPELIERFGIPIEKYKEWRVSHNEWHKVKNDLGKDQNVTHKRTHEYASYIIDAMETNSPYKIAGNVINSGLITNLPREACVEVPCLVDASGITPCYIGDLPPQLAALNRTNINMQLLTIEASQTLKKEHIYHAAFLDPHTSAELPIDMIVAMVDDLLEAHAQWLPEFK
jgi:alpha-galactosidase